MEHLSYYDTGIGCEDFSGEVGTNSPLAWGHMEVLLHHYAFGKPKDKYVQPTPAPESQWPAAMKRMTKEEIDEACRLAKRLDELQQQALGRPDTTP